MCVCVTVWLKICPYMYRIANLKNRNSFCKASYSTVPLLRSNMRQGHLRPLAIAYQL